MRCKKHPTDTSSTVGVCASCLRQRLLALMAAQAQLAQETHPRASAAESHWKCDPEPPPLLIPGSVSPKVTRRKSDLAATNRDNHFDLRFFNTPQVGPAHNTVNGVATSITTSRSFSKLGGRFSLLSRLFRSGSENSDTDLDRNSDARHSCDASSSSPSWFANIFSAGRKKKSRFAVEDSSGTGCRRPRRRAARGMSPAGGLETDCDDSDRCPSCSGDSEESSQVRRTPLAARWGKPGHGRNSSSGLVFCLSPLVRASPSRQWNQKGGLPPDLGDSKPHIASAASYCANRSRKLADFGRVNRNR